MRVSVDTGSIEATIVRIKGLHIGDIYLCALYLRPSLKLQAADLDAIFSVTGSAAVVIGADLNARHPDWGGQITNPNGRALWDWLLTCPTLEIRRTTEPTRGESYLDLFFTSVGILPVGYDSGQGTVTLDFDSDHKSLELLLKTDVLQPK